MISNLSRQFIFFSHPNWRDIWKHMGPRGIISTAVKYVTYHLPSTQHWRNIWKRNIRISILNEFKIYSRIKVNKNYCWGRWRQWRVSYNSSSNKQAVYDKGTHSLIWPRSTQKLKMLLMRYDPSDQRTRTYYSIQFCKFLFLTLGMIKLCVLTTICFITATLYSHLHRDWKLAATFFPKRQEF